MRNPRTRQKVCGCEMRIIRGCKFLISAHLWCKRLLFSSVSMVHFCFYGGVVVSLHVDWWRIIVVELEMHAFGRQLLKSFSRSICFSRFRLSIGGGNFKTAVLCQQSNSRTCRQLSTPVCQDHPRNYSTLHKTHCDVHRFGELRLTVGSRCDVTVSSLNAHLYLDQNLVIVDDTASRLSVDYHNSDGVSQVSISDSKDKEISQQNGQQSDVCNVEVPIKYGRL